MIFRVNRCLPSRAGLRSAAGVLRRGGIIVYPTDTAYALGGRFDSPRVIRRVLAIKGRLDRKFTLVAASLAQVVRHFRLTPVALRLARQYWPGPLSLVVSSRFAVRVPDAPIARRLARLAGAPLIATSANRHGRPAPSSAAAVARQFRHGVQPDLVVDAGRLPKRKSSTIVRVDGRGNVTVVRAGAVNVFYRPRPG